MVRRALLVADSEQECPLSVTKASSGETTCLLVNTDYSCPYTAKLSSDEFCFYLERRLTLCGPSQYGKLVCSVNGCPGTIFSPKLLKCKQENERLVVYYLSNKHYRELGFPVVQPGFCSVPAK